MLPSRSLPPAKRAVRIQETANKPALISRRIVVVNPICPPVRLERSSRKSRLPALTGRSFPQ